MSPDGAPVHTRRVTDAPDPVAAAVAALAAHKETCAACGDVLPCTRLPALRAAYRRAVTGRADESDQITTEEAAR